MAWGAVPTHKRGAYGRFAAILNSSPMSKSGGLVAHRVAAAMVLAVGAASVAFGRWDRSPERQLISAAATFEGRLVDARLAEAVAYRPLRAELSPRANTAAVVALRLRGQWATDAS